MSSDTRVLEEPGTRLTLLHHNNCSVLLRKLKWEKICVDVAGGDVINLNTVPTGYHAPEQRVSSSVMFQEHNRRVEPRLNQRMPLLVQQQRLQYNTDEHHQGLSNHAEQQPRQRQRMELMGQLQQRPSHHAEQPIQHQRLEMMGQPNHTELQQEHQQLDLDSGGIPLAAVRFIAQCHKIMSVNEIFVCVFSTDVSGTPSGG